MIARICIDDTRVAELRDDLQWYSDDPQLERILRTGYPVERFDRDAHMDSVATCVCEAASSYGVEPEFDASYPSWEYDPSEI